jgi:Fe-S-cluster containining protein
MPALDADREPGDGRLMARDVHVNLDTVLPLTCTREGACCHGNHVRVTPWETARLAQEMGVTHAAFVDAYCDETRTALRFDGPPDLRGLAACRLYAPAHGCAAHAARPLACRLFPLARRLQGGHARYFHRGPAFPCTSTCKGVLNLPSMRVSDYLAQQAAETPELAQDLYLELIADLAEGALVLYLDGGLAATGDRRALRAWKRLGHTPLSAWRALLPPAWEGWRDALVTPPLPFDPDPRSYVTAHAQHLQAQAQEAFGALSDTDALLEAAMTMMALAAMTGHMVGADVAALVDGFCRNARARA